MKQPLVSVIVPIYKVEPYLRRCLDSIVKQTYTNLEIILVDDGSPDGCPQICDEYAAKDKRIVVIHKENGGLSDARNAGLDICKGEYISFIDSDDWVANIYIEAMLKATITNNAEMVVGNFIRANQTYSLQISNYSLANVETLSPIQAVKKLWSPEYVIFVTAWAKLAKRNLYKDIRFPKGYIHEDEYTAYKLLYLSQKTIFLDIPLYCYYQRDDSIMGGVKPSSIRVLKARVEQFIFFKEHNEKELMDHCLKSLCWDLLFAYGQCFKGKCPPHFSSSTEILQQLRSSLKDTSKNILPFSQRLALRFFATFPFVYVLYQKIAPIKIREI